MASVAVTRPILVVLGLLLVAPLTFGSVDYIGFVVDDPAVESLLKKDFIPRVDKPYVDISGRRYYIGKLQGADVVIVNTGEHPVNVASGLQVLIDNFLPYGIISVTTAGSTDDNALEVGDVSLPEKIAFTGYWKWKQAEASGGDLVFGEYNVPESGQNSLGSIKFRETKFYTPDGSSTDVIEIPVTAKWLAIANKIEDFTLQQCLGASSSNCLNESPKVVSNSVTSSSVIYVNNKAYRDFLSNEFGASTVDEGSAAVAFTCGSSGIDFLVVRGVSNYAGGPGRNSRFGELGAINAVEVAKTFIPYLNHSTSVFEY
uniref:Uncharacterized protein MANES_09G126200 n=1 Tax=Rhizophora mucronata TaxID=61149 RepID=A0A2P2KHR3_RHIMU